MIDGHTVIHPTRWEQLHLSALEFGDVLGHFAAAMLDKKADIFGIIRPIILAPDF